VVGEEHYSVARRVQSNLQRYKELRDIIAILAWTNWRRRQARRVPCAQDPALPVATVQRGRGIHRFPGKIVPLADTIKGFKMIVDGECDALPEQAFYMVGAIEEAFEKAKTLK